MEYSIGFYKLDVDMGGFTLLDETENFLDLSYSKELNGIGSCSFKLSMHDTSATKTNLRRFVNHIAVWRESTLMFFGTIAHTSVSVENVDAYITVEAYSYLYHLRTRFSDEFQQFNQVEQGTIAWNLINTVQSRANGDLGIRQGLTITSVNRDRTYERFEIAQGLVNLSNVINGFDFEFNPVNSGKTISRVDFDCYYPQKGTDRTDLAVLTLPDGIKRLEMVSASTLYNDGISIGAGTDNPPTSTLSYGANAKSYTRREVILSEKDVLLPSTLALKLEYYLNRESVERYLIDVELRGTQTPSVDQFVIGDYLYYDFSRMNIDYINLSGKARCVGCQLSIDREGTETLMPRLEIL